MAIENLCSELAIRQLYALPGYSLLSDEYDFIIIKSKKKFNTLKCFKMLSMCFKTGRFTVHDSKPYCDRHNLLLWDNGHYVGPEV